MIREFCSEALRKTNIRDCSVILWISYMTADKLSLAFVIPDDTPRHERWKLVAVLGSVASRYRESVEDVFHQWRIAVLFPFHFLSTCLVFFDVELLA